MNSRTRCVLSVITIFLGQSFAQGASEAERALLARVTKAYQDSREAIKSVECRYSTDLNGMHHDIAYARDGQKVYLATLSGATASETACNGEAVMVRRDLDMLQIKRDKRLLHFDAPIPANRMGGSLDHALGFVKPENQTFQLRAARQIKSGDDEVIELEFAVNPEKATLVSRHGRATGYWPTHVKLTNADGTNRYEMTEVRYAAFDSGGAKVFYPVLIAGVSGTPSADAPANVTRLTVDVKTLRVNQPIASSRFTLTAWPGQKVMAWESGKITPAKDPSWDPRGKVGFPWIEPANAAYQQRTAAAAERSGDAHRSVADYAFPAAMLAGVVAIIAGAVMAFRGRQRA